MNPFGIVWYKGDSDIIHPGTLGLPSYHRLGNSLTLGDNAEEENSFGIVPIIIAAAGTLLSSAVSLFSSSGSKGEAHKQAKMQVAQQWIGGSKAALTAAGYPWEGVLKGMDLWQFGYQYDGYAKELEKLGYNVKVYQNLANKYSTTAGGITAEQQGKLNDALKKVETSLEKVKERRAPLIKNIRERWGWDPSLMFPDLKGVTGQIPQPSGVVPEQGTVAQTFKEIFAPMEAGLGTGGLILIGLLAAGILISGRSRRKES